MMHIDNISFTLRITDFTGKPEHRAEALYAHFSVSCPLHRCGCAGKVSLKEIFVGVESKYFGVREENFVLFSSPPKELEREIPGNLLPQLICPECGVVFRIIGFFKTLNQKALDFLSDKRALMR